VSRYVPFSPSGLQTFQQRTIDVERTGYQKLHQNITQGKADHHEGLDFYAPSPYPPTHTSSVASGNGNGRGKLRPLEGPNLWPEKPERMRGVLEGWVEKMKVLGMAVMRGMADGLGMSEGEWEGLRGMVDDTFWVMRLIGQSALPSNPLYPTEA